MTDLYITTSIPYVNGPPHLGHALEFVQVDALARHRAAAGASVRVQSGTDDHALKNVSAAARAGTPVSEFVRRNGDRFAQLAGRLGVGTDEFLRTSSHPRHRAGVTTLWRACADRGDLYLRDYTGLYCAGCEHFCTPDELTEGACPEHPADQVTRVTERNWFFRLSTYRDQLSELIRAGSVEVTPTERRNEVLGFLAGDVHDLSVSRPRDRAGGWGIGVPGDPDQVVYVWFDALATYITGLGYGSDHDGAFHRWWADPVERTHVVGKGIIRFHAVYWLAFLLSARLPLPSRILVHDYLTVDGAKIAKSGTQAADPLALVATHGQDALRWWLLRDPAPVGTTDFTAERLVSSYNQDLANTIGNLASRTLTLARRRAPWRTTDAPTCDDLRPGTERLADLVGAALDRFDFRTATREIVDLAATANRFLGAEAPWQLARAADDGDPGAAARFDAVVGAVLGTCSTIADALTPLVPAGARRLRTHLARPDGRPAPAFPRLLPATPRQASPERLVRASRPAGWRGSGLG